MKCSASQITCTADSAAAVRDAAAQFEGMLFMQLLRPLERALGPFGDLASAQIGSALGRAHGGFADVIVDSLRRQGAIE